MEVFERGPESGFYYCKMSFNSKVKVMLNLLAFNLRRMLVRVIGLLFSTKHTLQQKLINICTR